MTTLSDLLKSSCLYRKISRKTRTPLDFSIRHSGIQKRNSFIMDCLGAEVKWILDVGANQGHTSKEVASNGHFALGVEMFYEEYQKACVNPNPRAAFMNATVDPKFIENMPKWDAILLLSVLHRIYSFQGEEEMCLLLKAAGEKCGELFVEGSIRHARYTDHGQKAPDF